MLAYCPIQPQCRHTLGWKVHLPLVPRGAGSWLGHLAVWFLSLLLLLCGFVFSCGFGRFVGRFVAEVDQGCFLRIPRPIRSEGTRDMTSTRLADGGRGSLGMGVVRGESGAIGGRRLKPTRKAVRAGGGRHGGRTNSFTFGRRGAFNQSTNQ